jgi:hypothetical protein
MKKNAMTKIIAGLAFFWIVLSILSTSLLLMFSEPQTQEFTADQLTEIQKIIESQSWATSQSGEIIIPNLDISDKINISE